MLNISLLKEVRKLYQPKKAEIIKWVDKALVTKYNQVNIDIVIVNDKRSHQLNLEYRKQDKATNVISLEYESTRSKFNLLFGELILCDDIIVNEAITQNKTIIEHYAHMVVHGVLHLQGFDHINDKDANKMEQLEINIMQDMGFNNPYANSL